MGKQLRKYSQIKINNYFSYNEISSLNPKHFSVYIFGDSMKRLLLVALFVVRTAFADWSAGEEYHKKKDILVKQSQIANTCAFLLEHEFADTKLKQANCQYNIDLYFEMLNEMRRIEEQLSNKK